MIITIFQDYKWEGLTKKVTEIPSPGKSFNLSHWVVIKQDRTTSKACFVFDGSAKSKGIISLNDCVYSGPCFLSLNFNIVLTFRTGIGLVENVKQAL